MKVHRISNFAYFVCTTIFNKCNWEKMKKTVFVVFNIFMFLARADMEEKNFQFSNLKMFAHSIQFHIQLSGFLQSEQVNCLLCYSSLFRLRQQHVSL